MEMHLEEWPVILIITLLGLSFGSFATALSYRIPEGKNFILARSHCPKCEHVLGFFDLFPILSWLFQNGNCRYCKNKISISYPLTELSVAVLFLIIFFKFGISPIALILASLAVCLTIVTLIDLKHYIIPDSLNIIMFLLGVAYQFVLEAPLTQFIIGPILGLSIGIFLRWFIWQWKKEEGLGMGDVKFFVVVGIFLSPESIVTFLFLSGILGIVLGLLWRIMGKGKLFPFGPALALALLICLIAPEINDMFYLS